MNSRDVFRAALEFGQAGRTAMVLPSPYPRDAIFARRTGPADEKLAPAPGQLRRWRDEWGVTWASLTEFDKGEVVEPAVADWSQLDDWRPPDLGRPEDYADAAERFAADDEHFRIGYLPGFTFNVARKIRKLDNYLCDLVLYRDEVLRLNELVRAELLKAVACLADAGADAVMFGEDWGTQDRLMVSPGMWREMFRGEFEALAGLARRRGMHVIMHSCGKMTDIIDEVIDCGVSCLQFDQPRLHGIELLSKRYGGRVAFWCPVDIQTTLQTRDAEKIRSEARLLVEKLGCFGGGFVAGYYAGNEAIGLTPDVQDIACKAFVEFGS
jgi:hypothetical protein